MRITKNSLNRTSIISRNPLIAFCQPNLYLSRIDFVLVLAPSNFLASGAAVVSHG
jgi:hypothetical protein